MKNLLQIINRNRAYAELNLSRKQFENCLYPLWELGNATAFEVSGYVGVPINEVVGRFHEAFEKGFIDIYQPKPTKTNPRSGKENTNYVLTAKGKEAVRKLINDALKQEKIKLAKEGV